MTFALRQEERAQNKIIQKKDLESMDRKVSGVTSDGALPFASDLLSLIVECMCKFS
jgi:hypothetical protein